MMPYRPPVRPTSGYATVGMILALIGLCLPGVSFFALVFALMGHAETRNGERNGNGIAVAAVLISGVVSLVQLAFLAMFFLTALSEGVS